jgi:flagellin FlaB
MKSNGKFIKNDAAFTGLEAAIVLIAFVVVAAVFSYVMLGAGFFTSQKSKEVVHTGVDQATSSLQLVGDVYGGGANSKLDTAKVTISLTAGNNPVDLTKLTVSYQTDAAYEDNIYTGAASATAGYEMIGTANANNMLEQFERAQLNLEFPTNARTSPVTGVVYTGDERANPNERVTLVIKPASGATLQVSFTVPATIDTVMTLG